MTLPSKACVIGYPIEHSRSPLIHGYWLEKYGIEGVYSKIEVTPDELLDFLAVFQEYGIVGMNITLPHKEAVFAALKDVASAEAHGAGAVNTLWLENGEIRATNTDIYGFMAHLQASAPDWQKLDAPVAVLGAGGAARGIIFGLLQAGIPEIRLLNRTQDKAERLASEMKGNIKVCDWERRSDEIDGCGLLVNTTALGMTGKPPLEIGLAKLHPDAVVSDIVYAPLETELLRQAGERGLQTVEGLGMLLHQAVPGFEKWFGHRPEVTKDLRSHILADLLS